MFFGVVTNQPDLSPITHSCMQWSCENNKTCYCIGEGYPTLSFVVNAREARRHVDNESNIPMACKSDMEMKDKVNRFYSCLWMLFQKQNTFMYCLWNYVREFSWQTLCLTLHIMAAKEMFSKIILYLQHGRWSLYISSLLILSSLDIQLPLALSQPLLWWVHVALMTLLCHEDDIDMVNGIFLCSQPSQYLFSGVFLIR